MYSIKATWSGRTFALAKPNESGGKKSRNRIPREERKALVESFIKTHQRLNNGNFPSLSLTHREVGGSFYTIREIFREIIQENRVLGPAEFIFEEKSTDHEHKQSQSSSILMDPVAPLSLPQNGSSFALDHRHIMQEKLLVASNAHSSEIEAVETRVDEESINEEGCKNIEPHILLSGESGAGKLLEENAGLLAQYSPRSVSEISESLPASFSEKYASKHDMAKQENVEMLNGKSSTKPGERILENGKSVHSVHFDMENSKASEPIDVRKKEKDAAEAAVAEKTYVTESVLGTIATLESTVVEKFPLTESCNGQSSELENSCKTGKGIGAEGMTLKADNSGVYAVGQEISSATSAIPGTEKVEVIVDQVASKSFDPLEQRDGENNMNPEPMNVECTDAKDPVAVHARFSNVKETGESSNGTIRDRTTEQNLSTSIKVAGKAENGTSNLAVGKAALVHGTIMEEGVVDAAEDSSSNKGSTATLNRIKPESWKGASSDISGRETNPLVAILKSFVTAFVKFWSE